MTTVHRRSWLLLCLAALGAAGMFLGPDGWLGIDIGPIGSAVLCAALWLLLIHLSKHSEEAFPRRRASGRAPGLGCRGVRLADCASLAELRHRPSRACVEVDQISNSASRPFGIDLGMLIVGWIVVASVLRSGNRDAVELDERDLRIQRAASRAGSGLMALLIVALISALVTQPELLAPWLRPLIVANVLVGLLIASTLTENVYTVVRYGREHA